MKIVNAIFNKNSKILSLYMQLKTKKLIATNHVYSVSPTDGGWIIQREQKRLVGKICPIVGLSLNI